LGRIVIAHAAVSWFETRGVAALTMRVKDLIPVKCERSELRRMSGPVETTALRH
jgi:hypothetical protein